MLFIEMYFGGRFHEATGFFVKVHLGLRCWLDGFDHLENTVKFVFIEGNADML
jgi:hypothetical protein